MISKERDSTELMLALLRRLKVEMNGAVVDGMRERGLCYGLSYGVSVVTIKGIAQGYAPNHALARLLLRQGVRELQIAGIYIADPAQVSREELCACVKQLHTTELVDLSSMNLFYAVPDAEEVALDWLASDDPLVLKAGLMVLGRREGPPFYPEVSRDTNLRIETYLEAVERVAAHPDSGVHASVVYALRQLGRRSPQARAKVLALANMWRQSPVPQLRDSAEELTWQLSESM